MPELPVRIKDKRSGRYVVDNCVIDLYGRHLKSSGIAVYSVLCRFANNSTQKAFPSLTKISELIGMDRHTVIKYLDLIVSLKLAEKNTVEGRYTTYTLLEPTTSGEIHTSVEMPTSVDLHHTSVEIHRERTNERTNLLDKSNKAKPEGFGNLHVREAIGEFEKMVGFKPTDRKPNYEAWNLVRRIQSFQKDKGLDISDAGISERLIKYFKWIATQDWSDKLQTMGTVRLKFPIYESQFNNYQKQK